jgi:hypothetical protein
LQAINTGVFDYMNIHYHFIGSYVSTGTGPTGGNSAALAAAKHHDMGVFIISPSDKGGALYEPSRAFYKVLACLLGWLGVIDAPVRDIRSPHVPPHHVSVPCLRRVYTSLLFFSSPRRRVCR